MSSNNMNPFAALFSRFCDEIAEEMSHLRANLAIVDQLIPRDFSQLAAEPQQQSNPLIVRKADQSVQTDPESEQRHVMAQNGAAITKSSSASTIQLQQAGSIKTEKSPSSSSQLQAKSKKHSKKRTSLSTRELSNDSHDNKPPMAKKAKPCKFEPVNPLTSLKFVKEPKAIKQE